MKEDTNQLYFLLERLFKRFNLNFRTLPADLSQWQKFIERINKAFYDFDQERYLLERSLEISSREMLEVNRRLEEAQAIGHIGYWNYDPTINQTFWSKETYRQFGIDPHLPVPNLDVVMQQVLQEDRASLESLIDSALKEGTAYEARFRIRNLKTDNICWLFVKGLPHIKIKTDTEVIRTLSGICMDITEQVNAEEEVDKLNKQLIQISRQAGMSEIATSVLHNIGNVLNSINISTSMLNEILTESVSFNLEKICDIITAGLKENPEFFSVDDKGKLIPSYLKKLSEHIQSENRNMLVELDSIKQNIDYMKDIVVMQKDISGVSGIQEKINLPEICDLAIEMTFTLIESRHIHLQKDYHYKDAIVVDRSRLLQVLINLLKNAKYAVEQAVNTLDKVIQIEIKKKGSTIVLQIIDNGIGIEKTQLHKIFSMGYTTRREGHGFGLHSSANAAKEMGGQLTVTSEGVGMGAAFVLTLPEAPPTQSQHNSKEDNHVTAK